jgi:hypothetical protein
MSTHRDPTRAPRIVSRPAVSVTMPQREEAIVYVDRLKGGEIACGVRVPSRVAQRVIDKTVDQALAAMKRLVLGVDALKDQIAEARLEDQLRRSQEGAQAATPEAAPASRDGRAELQVVAVAPFSEDTP